MKRLCAMCRKSFEEEEFKNNGKKFNSYCKNCERIYQREYHRYYRTTEKGKEIQKRSNLLKERRRKNV